MEDLQRRPWPKEETGTLGAGPLAVASYFWHRSSLLTQLALLAACMPQPPLPGMHDKGQNFLGTGLS